MWFELLVDHPHPRAVGAERRPPQRREVDVAEPDDAAPAVVARARQRSSVVFAPERPMIAHELRPTDEMIAAIRSSTTSPRRSRTARDE